METEADIVLCSSGSTTLSSPHSTAVAVTGRTTIQQSEDVPAPALARTTPTARRTAADSWLLLKSPPPFPLDSNDDSMRPSRQTAPRHPIYCCGAPSLLHWLQRLRGP